MDPLASPRTTYATISAAFSGLQALFLLALPAFVADTLEPSATAASSAQTTALRASAFPILFLTYYQAYLSTGRLPPDSTDHFYTWFASLTTQTILFVTAYIRYSNPRPLTQQLSAIGVFGWGGLLIAAGGLASLGIWCLLFAEEGAGNPNARIRSSGWLFPTKDKRKEKVERREHRYGKAAIK